MILTQFLIGVNIYTSLDAPKDRGISYIEIWILGTQSPIALALFEYGFILYLKRVSKAWSLEFLSQQKRSLRPLLLCLNSDGLF